MQNNCIKNIIYLKIALVFNWMNGNQVKRINQASLKVLKISKAIQFFNSSLNSNSLVLNFFKMLTTKFNIYTYMKNNL